MEPLLWSAVVITALILLLPCALRLGIEIGRLEAEADSLEEPIHRPVALQRGVAASRYDSVPNFSRAH
jgi:hypothetical protein